MSIEWYIPDTTTLVRQGDFLICRDPHSGVIEEICLVITADCDISKGKFGRQLACLRIISMEAYIRTIWPAKKLADAIEIASTKVAERLNKWNSERIGERSELSQQAVISWVRRSEPDAICNSLNVPEKEAAKLIPTLRAFKDALAVLSTDPRNDKLKQLAAFRAALQSKEIEECWQEVLRQARDEKKQEDIFLLPTLPQLEYGPAVVLLREIVGVKYESICYTTMDATSNEMFLRVGRLNPTYKYAVSQAFGTLFSRIGLPEEYESRCKKTYGEITELAWE